METLGAVVLICLFATLGQMFNLMFGKDFYPFLGKLLIKAWEKIRKKQISSK